MKYAIIILLIIFVIFILAILYLKKIARLNSTQEIENIKTEVNDNPAKEIVLVDYKKYQVNIYHSKIGETLSFKKDKNKRIKVLNNSKCIGIIPAKEVRKIELLEQSPNYYEGKIIEFQTADLMTHKVCVTLQIKKAYSKDVYNLNHNYLYDLINIHTLFKKDQIVQTNYGPSTILEVHDNFLIVDVPSLGKREIYNVTEIEIN